MTDSMFPLSLTIQSLPYVEVKIKRFAKVRNERRELLLFWSSRAEFLAGRGGHELKYSRRRPAGPDRRNQHLSGLHKSTPKGSSSIEELTAAKVGLQFSRLNPEAVQSNRNICPDLAKKFGILLPRTRIRRDTSSHSGILSG